MEKRRLIALVALLALLTLVVETVARRAPGDEPSPLVSDAEQVTVTRATEEVRLAPRVREELPVAPPAPLDGRADVGPYRYQLVDADTQEPVEGGRIELDRGGHVQRLAVDSAGFATLDRPALRDVRALATAPGYAAEELACPPPESEQLEVVRMRPSTTIAGMTTVLGRPTALPGLTVLAFLRTRPLPLRLTRDELLGLRGVLTGETRSDGSFVLEGANPDERYDVVVGGLGWTSNGLTPVSGSAQIQVAVGRVHGHLMRIRDGSGTPSLNGAFGGRGFGTPRFDRMASFRGDGVSWVLPAAGLNAELSAAIEECRTTPLTKLVLFHVGPDAALGSPALVGPVELQFELAGYEQVSTRFECAWIGAGLTSETIELRRNVAGWGELRLEFAAERSALALPPMLHLEPRDGRGRAFFFSEPTAQSARHVSWEGVPAGSYTLSFQLGWQMNLVPLESTASPAGAPVTEIVVEPDTVTHVRPSASIDAQLHVTATRDGRPYAGRMELRFELVEGSQGNFLNVDLPSANAVLDFLPRGTYDVTIGRPRIGAAGATVLELVGRTEHHFTVP